MIKVILMLVTFQFILTVYWVFSLAQKMLNAQIRCNEVVINSAKQVRDIVKLLEKKEDGIKLLNKALETLTKNENKNLTSIHGELKDLKAILAEQRSNEEKAWAAVAALNRDNRITSGTLSYFKTYAESIKEDYTTQVTRVDNLGHKFHEMIEVVKSIAKSINKSE